MVEGQHVGVSALPGSAELGQLFQPGGNCGTLGIDDRGHHGLSAAPVRVGMGGDDPLVDAPGHGDRDVAGSANTTVFPSPRPKCEGAQHHYVVTQHHRRRVSPARIYFGASAIRRYPHSGYS